MLAFCHSSVSVVCLTSVSVQTQVALVMRPDLESSVSSQKSLEVEMEKLEVAGPWSRPESGSVDPKGKMGHEEKEKPKEVEMAVDDDVPQEESIDFQSPRKKGIRVESEGTQDCVRETLAIGQEEADEMGFVPSALGEPRGPFIGATIDAVRKKSNTGR